jgi:hypothetical protein
MNEGKGRKRLRKIFRHLPGFQAGTIPAALGWCG